MGSFSKQLPLNSDSSLGPVTIGSRIMVERGKDPLPLEGGNVELVSGCGWDAGTVTISKQMTPARNKLDIDVKLAPEIPLAHYVSVILKKKPIKLKVTLFPRALVPGMGVPVNVPTAPVTDDVDVTIPAVPQPDIDLDVKFAGKAGRGTYQVLATVLLKLPPYISKKDRETVAKKITIDITKPKNVSVEKGELTPNENGAACELTATPDFTKKSGTPAVTIVAKASLLNISLKKEKQVVFEPQKNYILNIQPGSLEVKKNKPASLTAQVFEILTDDRRVPVTDARLSIDGGSDLILVSPGQGSGKLECRVSQQKVTGQKQVVLAVHATAGNDSIKPQAVAVNLETIDYGTLDVAFIPPEKDHLNPFINNDHVEMKAKMLPPPGKEPVKADIEFRLENPGGWLNDVSTHAVSVDGDGSKDATFFGRILDPGSPQAPPPYENVIFTATFEGTVIDEKKIGIKLDPKPALIADNQQVCFLANAKQGRPGRPDAVPSVPVTLAVTNPGEGEWKISVEYSETEKKLVSCSEKDKTASSQTLLFEIADDIPFPGQKPGTDAWQQVIKVATSAVLSNPTMGDLKIDGPVIELLILHEGIYPKSLYEYDEAGALHDVTEKNRITYHVFDPAEKRAPLESVTDIVERHIFPYLTFEIREWDGKGLISTGCHTILSDPGPSRSNDGSPAGYQWDFIFFSLKGSEIEVVYSGEMDGPSQKISTGKWHVVFQKQIPGNGEKANGFVRFYVDGYYDPANHDTTLNWQYELPLTLQLGDAKELEENLSYIVEGGRCEKIIDKCFPEQHREKLRKELEALPCKGAKDLRFFSRELHDRAYEIWTKENADYLSAEASWSRWINVAEKASFTGDLAFNALVMFYTAGLGPYANFAVSNIAGTIKSESIAVYAYYVERGAGRDLPTCIQAYIDENWVMFLANLVSGATVDTYLLGDFDVNKVLTQPRKYGKMFAWLWLWKFQFRLAEGIGKEDGGFINAAYKATEDLGILAVNVLLGQFVTVHGSTDLRDLYGRVRRIGYFGGKVPPAGETDKDKPPGKDKADKEKQPDKDKPDKEKQPDKDKPDKEKQPDKDKPDKEKQPDKKEPGKKGEEPESHSKTEPPHKGTPLGKEFREFTYEDAPGADVGKLTRGMTEEHMTAAKKIAADENVDLLVRSTTEYAEKLIRTGQADPKPEYVKTKTIDANDLKLNPDLTEADLGKVGYFDPKPPKRGDFESGPKGDADFAAVESRYRQRKQEFADQKGHIDEHSALDPISGQKLVVEGGKVKKVLPDGTTRDITGDYDVFGVIDRTTGKPVTDPVKMERIYNRLKKEMNVQHPWQSQWDYRNEAKTVPPGSPEGAQAPYDVKRGIDQKIVGSHTKGTPKAEPLIRFGSDGRVTGTWITGVSGE